MTKSINLKRKAALVRKWCLISTTQAGSGHPSSCLSAADIATVLFDEYYTFDIKNPQNPNNDRLIFSKGHAAPLLYTLYAVAGAFPLEELKTLRQLSSRLEGHPTLEFPYTEAATGALGQGLSIGAGIALSGKKENLVYKTYVLLGDGELAEGNIWEACNFASYYKLDNLIAILDINGLGQSQETMFGHHISEYAKRFEAFGWGIIEIDGHNFSDIQKAYDQALKTKDKPFAIIADTQKGKGVSLLEGKDGWHGKAIPKDQLDKAIVQLGQVNDSFKFALRLPQKLYASFPLASVRSRAKEQHDGENSSTVVIPQFHYSKGEQIATREVYGKVLAHIATLDDRVYALDGDVKNSTFSYDFKNVFPDRFVECFIAEQNMVGAAVGLSSRGKIPFVSTVAAFFTRAADQIRMAALSKANIKFVGSHAGVSIGEDGASQMGLEDFALFGAIADSIIFHPSDATSSAKILPLIAAHSGISYVRTLRPKTPVLYDVKEQFKIGGSKILRFTQNDMLSIAAAGITVHEALKAYEELKKKGVLVRIVDCYSIKPIDKKTLEDCVKKTQKNVVITVEDHYDHGGLGDFVQSALASSKAQIYKMAVSQIPHSGTKDELLKYVGISAEDIMSKVLMLVKLH